MNREPLIPEQIAEIIRLNGMYWRGEEGGVCANLRGANLVCANLDGANLRGANLDGANLHGLRAAAMSVFSGLYEYQCWAVVSREGIPWVRMGCLWKSVEEWDRIGIRQSNVREFPNDGSEKCERRVRAFNFTKAEALRLAAKVQPEAAPEPAPPYTEADEVRLTEAGRTMWTWAPTSAGTVVRCGGGWTLIEFDDCILSIPDDYLERTSGGAK